MKYAGRMFRIRHVVRRLAPLVALCLLCCSGLACVVNLTGGLWDRANQPMQLVDVVSGLTLSDVGLLPDAPPAQLYAVYERQRWGDYGVVPLHVDAGTDDPAVLSGRAGGFVRCDAWSLPALPELDRKRAMKPYAADQRRMLQEMVKFGQGQGGRALARRVRERGLGVGALVASPTYRPATSRPAVWVAPWLNLPQPPDVRRPLQLKAALLTPLTVPVDVVTNVAALPVVVVGVTIWQLSGLTSLGRHNYPSPTTAASAAAKTAATSTVRPSISGEANDSPGR